MKIKPGYKVMLDGGEQQEVIADSLAALADAIRGKARTRARVWSPYGVQLLDTKFGDPYAILDPTEQAGGAS